MLLFMFFCPGIGYLQVVFILASERELCFPPDPTLDPTAALPPSRASQGGLRETPLLSPRDSSVPPTREVAGFHILPAARHQLSVPAASSPSTPTLEGSRPRAAALPCLHRRCREGFAPCPGVSSGPPSPLRPPWQQRFCWFMCPSQSLAVWLAHVGVSASLPSGLGPRRGHNLELQRQRPPAPWSPCRPCPTCASLLHSPHAPER